MKKHIMDRLFEIIQTRKETQMPQSYTTKLLKEGKNLCARKIGEEAVELVVAALGENEQSVINESADLIYHWLVLMTLLDIPPSKIYKELQQRMQISES